MKLSEVIKKSKRQMISGWVISLFAFIILAMAFVKFVYTTTYNDISVFRHINHLTNSAIVWVYQKAIIARLLYWSIWIQLLLYWFYGELQHDSGTIQYGEHFLNAPRLSLNQCHLQL